MTLRNTYLTFGTFAATVACLNAQTLNSELFEALHSYRSNPASLHSLRSAVARRADAMRDLIANDPVAALASAIPADARLDFPPAVRDLIEEQVTLDGQMEVTIEDGPGYSRVNYRLLSGGRRIALHFADRFSGELRSGTPVQVQGVRVGDSMAL